MKRQINDHFLSCFEQLTSGKKFLQLLQILEKLEPEYFETHFRKLNGLWISIYSTHNAKFSPEEIVGILDSFKTLKIKHKSVILSTR